MNQTTIGQTKGGLRGHILRRIMHIGMVLVPLVYYAYGTSIASWFFLTPHELLWLIMVFVILFEILRLKLGITLFVQRHYETGRISSFPWTVLSICLVLWLAPDKRYAIPIICSCALVDPLLGELRRLHWKAIWVACIGILAVMAIWWVSTWWWQTPWQLALLMGPLTVWCEWPNFRWIDDNALMQLVPLLVIMLLYG